MPRDKFSFGSPSGLTTCDYPIVTLTLSEVANEGMTRKGVGPQGETRSLTNSTGAVSDTYNYNAYGEMISSTGTTTNPYRYGGKYGYYSDFTSSLILATQRWYSPQMMRWVTRDPIGYQGGVNLYEYVGGRAAILVDPKGTDWLTNLGDASAGFGDSLTFGLTGMAREKLGMVLFGTPTGINEDSIFYDMGEGAAILHGCLLSGGVAAEALGYRAFLRRYARAGGGGLVIKNKGTGKRLISFDLHKIGRGEIQYYRPHIDFPKRKHWPW